MQCSININGITLTKDEANLTKRIDIRVVARLVLGAFECRRRDDWKPRIAFPCSEELTTNARWLAAKFPQLIEWLVINNILEAE